MWKESKKWKWALIKYFYTFYSSWISKLINELHQCFSKRLVSVLQSMDAVEMERAIPYSNSTTRKSEFRRYYISRRCRTPSPTETQQSFQDLKRGMACDFSTVILSATNSEKSLDFFSHFYEIPEEGASLLNPS